MVSHELRIPLTSIIGWAIVLLDPNVGEAARKRALEVIERNARFQVKLIEDILDLSRIAAGTLRLDIEIVPIIPVLQAAIDTLRPDADAKQVRIETALDPKAGLLPNVLSPLRGSAPAGIP